MPTTTTGNASEFITFSRTSNATVTDSDGKIKWAPHNLLTNSEQFDAASWVASGTVIAAPTKVAANAVAAPNGTTTADEISFPAVSGAGDVSILVQSFTNMPTVQHTYGIWVKAKAAGDIGKQIVLYGWTGVMSVKTHTTLDGTWQYVSTSGTWTANNPNYAVGVIGSTYGGVNQGAVSVYLWGAHIYRSDLGGMKSNTSAYPMYNPTTPKNLLGYTEEFSNAAWVKSSIAAFGSGSIANATAAPNGIMSADLIAENTTNTEHAFYQSVSSQTTSTVSIYAKYSGRHLSIRVYSTTNVYVTVTFDLINGAVSQTNNVGGVFGSVVSSITSIGNGWFRCSVTSTRVSGTTIYAFNLSNSTTPTLTVDGSPAYTGDGVSGVYLWGAQLSDSASLDAYVPNNGAAPTAAAYYGPRLDYDPVTLAAKGLLVEESRTNLLLHSAAFDNAAWSKDSLLAFGSGSTVNATTAPDGTVTADLITSASATAASGIGQSSISLSAAAYTWSIYIKPNGGRYVQLLWTSSASTNYANFDLQSTTYVPTAGTYTAATITPVSNGFFRVTITSTVAAVSGGPFCWFIDSGSAARGASFTGDGVKGAYVWGAQVEAGSFATSYIPVGSTTAGATRNADVASVGTNQFPYSQPEGSLVVAFTPTNSIASNTRIAELSGGSSARVLDLYSDGTRWTAYNGTATITVTSPVAAVGALTKVGAVYKSGDYAVLANGGTAYTATSATVNTATSLYIGMNSVAAQLNGHIRQITYLPRRISNAELQTRTSA